MQGEAIFASARLLRARVGEGGEDPMKRKIFEHVLAALRPALALCLALLLASRPAFAATLSDDKPGTELPNAPEAAEGLEITILEGEGALNNIRQRTAREPIVQVEDKNHKPVAGALILFSIRDASNGAGATFNGTATEFRTVTDASGRAQTHGYTPNGTSGQFYVTITATSGQLTATAILHQQNLDPLAQSSNASKTALGGKTPPFLPKNPFLQALIVGGVVAGGVALGVVLTRNNGARITAGAGTVAAP
jgi:short subunit dehydrogenase-like uncharacterized protein